MRKEILIACFLLLMCGFGLFMTDFLWPGVFGNRNIWYLSLLILVVWGANYLGYWILNYYKSEGGYIYFGVGFLVINILVIFFWFWWMGLWSTRWEEVTMILVAIGLINFIGFLLFRFEDKNIVIGKVVDSKVDINKN